MQRQCLFILSLQLLLCVTDSAFITGTPFQLELQKVLDNALGVSEMQKAYDGQTNSRNSVTLDGQAIVEKISSSMSSRVSRLLTALVKLKDAVEQNYDSSTTTPQFEECCGLTGTNYDTRFRSEIDHSSACYTKSPNGDQSSAKYPTSAVEVVMKENYEQNNNLLWQYFGSETGTYINYPSVKLTNCDYDPRFRPYYANAASPKAKDLVIAIDTSTSMSQPAVLSKTLMQIAKEAAITVVKTLNPNDRIGIVSFNDKATKAKVTRSPCFTEQLGVATTDNTKSIITYINSLSFNGGTNYENALRASFEYFKSSEVSLQGEERDRVILFLTDGEPAPGGANPLQVIREENGYLNNSVFIFTYGLGQLSESALQLLKNMSLQTMNDPTKGETKSGISVGIKDPSDLVSTMGSYYNSLGKGPTEATFTVPYKDAFSKIGLLTSVCLPAFNKANFIGVVCIDMKISDLKSEMSILIDSDEKSYSFLIDGYGHTLVHPLLPLPWSVSDDVILLDISHFETSLKDTPAIDQMKRYPWYDIGTNRGQNGNITLQNTRTLPRGMVLEEGITTNIVSSRIYWKKVLGTNYTVCVVIGGSGTKHVLEKEKGRDGIFSYHITRLGSDKLNRCRHFARYATKDKSLIMLSPSAFNEPYKYLDSPETETTVTKYENYFKGITTNDDTFKDTVLTSMVVTNNVEPLWINSQTEASYVIWRYIATVDGIVRMYPGVEIKKDYDPKLRPWYWRSIAEKGKMVISAPYKDAWGSGYLITLSTTIFEGRSNNLHTNPSEETVTAVMGTDFPIYFFYHLLLEKYPICGGSEYSCFMIDTSGFVVIHKDFTTVYTDPKLDDLYHITKKEGKIARDLMSKGVLTKRTCTDYQTVQDQLTYRVGLTSFYRDGIDTFSNGDPEYEMRPIENTNIFLIIKKTSSDKSPCCQMQISPSLLQCTSEVSECECLCYRKIPFNYCSNKYASSDSSPPCSAPAPKYDSVFEEGEQIKNLQTCFETKCDIRNNIEHCYKVAGCSWCVETASGSRTKPPFCALKEICQFGKCKDDSTCKKSTTEEKTTTENPAKKQEGLSIPMIIGISSGCIVGVLLIILVVVLIFKRRSNSDYLTAVDVDRGNVGVRGGPYGFPVQERSGYINPLSSSQNSTTNLDIDYITVNNEMTTAPPDSHNENHDRSGHYLKVTHML